MAQFAIDVQFTSALPTPAALVQILEKSIGEALRLEIIDDDGFILMNRSDERVVVANLLKEGIVYVRVDQLPSDFQWLIVAGLKHLGGTASNTIPPAILRRFDGLV